MEFLNIHMKASFNIELEFETLNEELAKADKAVLCDAVSSLIERVLNADKTATSKVTRIVVTERD